jgi:hypothetical protein
LWELLEMEFQKKIQKAQVIIDSFSGEDRTRLLDICNEIKRAQDDLNREAKDYFNDCMQRCQGICCRNIGINDVVTLLDLIYILAINKKITARVHTCAQAETLFPADCLFLQNGQGPCLFSANSKPERCIITFCGEVRPIRKEIRAVRSKFNKLSRYTKIKRPFLWVRF